MDGLPKSCILYYILGAVKNTFPDEFAMYSPSRALENYDVVIYVVLDYLLESLGAVIKVIFSNSLKRKHFSPIFLIVSYFDVMGPIRSAPNQKW